MPTHHFISLTAPPPDGFAFDPAPSPATLADRLVCLYSDDPLPLARLIDSLPGTISGVLATGAPTLTWSRSGPRLYRLGVPGELTSSLSVLTTLLMDVLQRLEPGDVGATEPTGAYPWESEERVRALVENAWDVFWAVDIGMRFTYVSPSATRIHQWSPQEWIHLQVKDVLTPEALERVNRVLAEELAREGLPGVDPNRSRTLEIRQYRKDGSVFWGELRAGFLRDAAGRPVGIMGITRDISERKAAEAERARLESRLLRAHQLESVGRLAGGVAHELNNMLTPILGYGDMLIQDLSADEPGRAMVEQILLSARRCRDLVSQLLAFASRQALEMRPVDLNEVISGFGTMLRRTIREDITIEARLMPAACPVLGDRARLEEVVLSLAANAEEAMPRGGTLRIETREVSLEGEVWGEDEVKAGPYGMMTISDTGEGMDQETVDRVFDPFFTTREVGKGTGLGLSTVFGIVRQHGGHIRVSSDPGRGTTFHLYFPRLAGELLEGLEASVEERPASGTETVLVVEDEEPVRDLALRILERQGYRVLEAGDGQAALVLLEDHDGPVDLLLTDVVLPNMSGMELWQLLRQRRTGLRVLFMSGYPADAVGAHGELEAALPYIQKPFSIQALSKKVRELLNSKDAV